MYGYTYMNTYTMNLFSEICIHAHIRERRLVIYVRVRMNAYELVRGYKEVYEYIRSEKHAHIRTHKNVGRFYVRTHNANVLVRGYITVELWSGRSSQA